MGLRAHILKWYLRVSSGRAQVEVSWDNRSYVHSVPEPTANWTRYLNLCLKRPMREPTAINFPSSTELCTVLHAAIFRSYHPSTWSSKWSVCTSSYNIWNLNFKLIVTHIIAPHLSIENIFSTLYYIALVCVCVTGVCVCTHTGTGCTGEGQVIFHFYFQVCQLFR